MDTYTIIEDVFGDEDGAGQNQVTAARGFVTNSHVPEDMKRPMDRAGRAPPRQEYKEYRDVDPRMSRNSYVEDPSTRNDKNMSPMVNALVSMGPSMYPGVDGLSCREVFSHVEHCPMCKSYFRHDAKFYWLIIGILIAIIFLTTRRGK
jgi:hypothetical protein